MRKFVSLLAATLALLLNLQIAPTMADGSESLGPPSIAIASGTGISTGAVGLATLQPGNIDVSIPNDAIVKQVLLYWEGNHANGSPPDNTAIVNGLGVTGALIGGPTLFFDNIYSSSFRADITALGAVKAGNNSVAVSGLDFSYSNNGAGMVVIFDDGSAPASIQVRDGNDLAFAGFNPPKDTTVPQTFTVPAASVSRAATLNLQVSSIESDHRPNKILVTVGDVTTTLVNPLSSSDGPQWDSLDIPITFPPGVTTATVQVVSAGDGTANNPASFAWIAATLSVQAAIDPCTVPSDTPATTRGSAYSLDATALNLELIDRKGLVRSQAPGQPPASASHFANADVPGLVSAGLLTTQSNSSLDPSTSTASAQVANVSLLNGLVKATAVEAVSQSVAGTDAATYNSNGSKIVGLTVNNSAITVAPNTKVAVKSRELGGIAAITIAELYVYEESGSSTYQGGVSKSSHSVNMLRLVLLKPFLGFPSGTQVIVAHAESDAQSPTIGCPGLKSVSGEAFTAYVDGNLAGKDFVEVKVGEAVLPSTGGSNSDGTNVSIPGVVTSNTATNTTSGSLNPHPNATSQSVVQSVNVLNGLITADVLNVKCASSANGTNAGTTLKTEFLNLKVDNHTIESNPAPNKHRVVPLPDGKYVSIIINEQVNENGTTDTEGTVNALHIRVYALNGLLEGEIIIASAHCDAHSK